MALPGKQYCADFYQSYLVNGREIYGKKNAELSASLRRNASSNDSLIGEWMLSYRLVFLGNC